MAFNVLKANIYFDTSKENLGKNVYICINPYPMPYTDKFLRVPVILHKADGDPDSPYAEAVSYIDPEQISEFHGYFLEDDTGSPDRIMLYMKNGRAFSALIHVREFKERMNKLLEDRKFTDRFVHLPIEVANSKQREILGENTPYEPAIMRLDPAHITEYFGLEEDQDADGKPSVQVYTTDGRTIMVYMKLEDFENLLNLRA